MARSRLSPPAQERSPLGKTPSRSSLSTYLMTSTADDQAAPGLIGNRN
jgi:hypothetical protein